MISALLLGRKNSVGFPGKNLYPVVGRPLALYPMLAALNSKYVDEVYLSTDDERLMKLAKDLGVQVIKRPPELCTKEALGEDAYLHGYQILNEKCKMKNIKIELLVLLFCNAPTVLAEQIDKGVEILRSRPEADSAVTVSAYNMWSPLRARRLNSNGYLDPFVPFETFGDPKSLNCDRDSQGNVFFADMGLSVVRARCLKNLEEGLLPQKWMGSNILPIKQWGGCDVDFEWQIPQVEFWLRKHGFSETKTPYDKNH